MLVEQIAQREGWSRADIDEALDIGWADPGPWLEEFRRLAKEPPMKAEHMHALLRLSADEQEMH
jgi:hypothetical protein